MRQLAGRRDAALKNYLQVVASLPTALPAERGLWLAAWRAGDEEAGRCLMESFLSLAVNLAVARRGGGVRFEPLLAAANRALGLALDAYQGPLEGLPAVLTVAVEAALEVCIQKAAPKK
jgi:hypothetical protein